MPHGPRGKSSAELRKIGQHEAEELDLDAPFKKRLILEVKNYADEYGIPSLADVVTEYNSRGKDLEFQGELAVYATENEAKIKRGLEQLVKEGKLRHVKIPGHKVGYGLPLKSQMMSQSRPVIRTNRRTRRKYPIRRGTTYTYGKALADLSADDF